MLRLTVVLVLAGGFACHDDPEDERDLPSEPSFDQVWVSNVYFGGEALDGHTAIYMGTTALEDGTVTGWIAPVGGKLTVDIDGEGGEEPIELSTDPSSPSASITGTITWDGDCFTAVLLPTTASPLAEIRLDVTGWRGEYTLEAVLTAGDPQQPIQVEEARFFAQEPLDPLFDPREQSSLPEPVCP